MTEDGYPRAAAAHADELERTIGRLLSPMPTDGRALAVGAGLGAFAKALARHVREVVAIDLDERPVREGGDEPANVEFVHGDVMQLPFPRADFDVVGCLRLLHRARRPELVVSELARVLRPHGRLLLVDQLAPVDPLTALALDRFERERDPSHMRLLSDADVRALLDANDLVVVLNQITQERSDVVAGPGRPDARTLARESPTGDLIEVGWYVARPPLF